MGGGYEAMRGVLIGYASLATEVQGQTAVYTYMIYVHTCQGCFQSFKKIILLLYLYYSTDFNSFLFLKLFLNFFYPHTLELSFSIRLICIPTSTISLKLLFFKI